MVGLYRQILSFNIAFVSFKFVFCFGFGFKFFCLNFCFFSCRLTEICRIVFLLAAPATTVFEFSLNLLLDYAVFWTG